MSSLVYCLTRSYFDEIDPLPTTDHELVLFSVGFGMEEVLLRDKDSSTPPSVEVDGVWCSEDYYTVSEGNMDLKTTRMYSNPDGSPKRGWPDTWLEQFKGYAYVRYKDEILHRKENNLQPAAYPYSVGVLYTGPAELVCGTFMFTGKELEEQWAYVQERKTVYNMFRERGMTPTPFAFNKDWECNGCRYQLRCKTWEG